MPLGLPSTIRHLNSYTPQMSPTMGVDLLVPFDGWRAFQVGLHLDCKAMEEDATVKNYHMQITRGGETLSGMFTGDVKTETRQWLLSVPVQIVWRVNKVNIKVGPYASLALYKIFGGYAHNGYLRVDDPTGAKVILGEDENERGDYEFDKDVRGWQIGIDLGADWQLSRRIGLYADLNWGLSPLFKGSFRTIEQSLYPIYGQLGMTYRLK